MLDAPRSSAGARLFAWSGAALFAGSLVFFLYSYLVRFGWVPPSGTAGPALRGVLVNVALFGVFAMHHSVAARAAVKARLTKAIPPRLERSVYTWTASLLFIAVCANWQFLPGELYHLTGAAAWPGYLLQGGGVLMTIGSSARLDVLDLAGVRPLLNANPAADPSHVPLETRGPYGFVRHPLYFAWAVLVFGAPHMTSTRFAFALISCSYLAIAIPLEERSLIRTFGADYLAYRKQVRWRMLPWLY